VDQRPQAAPGPHHRELARPDRRGHGDGSVGRGVIVKHAYARLGTYKGTLTLSDRAGNAATAAFTVFVGETRRGSSSPAGAAW
jgi:PKD domain